jgi:hypothetical protein
VTKLIAKKAAVLHGMAKTVADGIIKDCGSKAPLIISVLRAGVPSTLFSFSSFPVSFSSDFSSYFSCVLFFFPFLGLTLQVGALLVSLLEKHYKEQIPWAALTPLYGMDWDRVALERILKLFPDRTVW